jgi:hypothetical protein
MRETPREVEELQRLIDRSSARMGPHPRSIMDPDRWSIGAADICDYLSGIRHLALATSTPSENPGLLPLMDDLCAPDSSSEPGAIPFTPSTSQAHQEGPLG